MNLNLLPAGPLFALAAAILWGGGDFSGGMGAKHAGGTTRASLRVVLLSHIVSFTVLLLAAHLRADPFPHGAPLYWGLTAGVAGGLSLTAFYIALSRGAMGASAAISGLLAAAIPAAVSIAQDGSPGPRRIVGFALAGIAIWRIAAGPNPENTPQPLSQPKSIPSTPSPAKPNPAKPSSTLTLAILSGFGFGIYFVALKYAGAAGILWPMATARIGSLTTCSVILLILTLAGIAPETRSTGQPLLNRTAVLWCLSTALLDTSGNMLFVAATRAGRLDVAAVLASLYPATTILFAAWTLHEKPTRRQALGMALAAVAVVLITL